MDDLSKKQEQRNRLLCALHDATNGSMNVGTDYFDLAASLGFTLDETQDTMDYLVHVTRWAQYTSLQGACMTAEGVVEVERAVEAEKAGVSRRAEVEQFRAMLEGMTTAEIENNLARGVYGDPSGWKVPTAANGLQAKRREQEWQRREQGEAAALRKEVAALRDELRTEKNKLRVAMVAAVAAILTALAAWRQPLADFITWVVAVLKRSMP